MPPKPKSKSKSSSSPQCQQQSPKQNQHPNWPPLRPLPPTSSLTLSPIIPDQIYLIKNFFTAPLCKNYVQFLSSLPLVTTPSRPKRGEAVRINDRFQVEDARFSGALWEGSGLREAVCGFLEESCLDFYSEEGAGAEDEDEEVVLKRKTTLRKRIANDMFGGEPLGLNPNIRVYRYTKGQFFGKHYDDSNTLLFKPPASKSNPQIQSTTISARTTWTLLIYLSTCDGGETVFYPDPTRENRNPDPIAIAPETGMALLHRHGERCLLHEGREVRGGEKWVLRSDLVVARS